MSWEKAKEKAREEDKADSDEDHSKMQWVIPLLACRILLNNSRLICFLFDLQSWLASVVLFFYFVRDGSSAYNPLQGVVRTILSLCISTLIPLAMSRSIQGAVMVGKVMRMKDDDFVIRLITCVTNVIGKVLILTVTKLFIFICCSIRPKLSLQVSYQWIDELKDKLVRLKRWIVRLLFKVYDFITMKKREGSINKVVPIDYDELDSSESVHISEEKARVKAEEKARVKAEEEARVKAEEEARVKAEEEARVKDEEEARVKAEEEARVKDEVKANLKAEEKANLKAEEKVNLKADEKQLVALAKDVKELSEVKQFKALGEAKLQRALAEAKEMEKASSEAKQLKALAEAKELKLSGESKLQKK